MEPDIILLAAVAAAFFIGGIAKGAVGFGMPLVSLPLISTLIDVRVALALMTIPILASNVWQASQGGVVVRVFRDFWWLLVAMTIGCAIGALLMVRLDSRYIFMFMGGAVICFSLASTFAPTLAVPPSHSRSIGSLAGFIGGVLGGSSTFFGPPIVMYFMALHLPKDLFVGAVSSTWLLASVLLVGSYLSLGLLTWHLAVLSLVCVVPVAAGMGVGQWLRNRVNARVFRRALLAFLFLIGANLIRRALV